MRTESNQPNWRQPGYGIVSEVERDGAEFEVTFANGDVARLPSALFGIHGDYTVDLVGDDEGLSIEIATAETSRVVSWSQLRTATDSDFAQELRRQDAEEAKRLGRRLKALREDRNLSQKDLAQLVGMSSPQLSKIEKGSSDLRVSTVQSLLRAMGATIADIAGPGALEVSQRTIRKRIEQRGVGRDLLDRIFAIAPRADVPSLLQRSFGWDLDDLSSSEPLPVTSYGFVFKAKENDHPEDSPLVSLARTVSEVVWSSTSLPPYSGVPTDPAEVRTEILKLHGHLGLESLTEWTLNAGIPVVPLRGKGGFVAAAWTFDATPSIVIKDVRDPAAFWLFDLAHEIGHVANGDLESAGIVDVDELRPMLEGDDQIGDLQERAANEYALRLVLGDYEGLVAAVRNESRGNYLRFKNAVAGVAHEASVSVGMLGLVSAYELTDIGEPKDRWGSSTNLARSEGNGHLVVYEALTQRADFSSLENLDGLLLAAAVAPGDKADE